ncbi:MAG: copper amine oxidase N-terminal domain-containing protein [Desulfotomaculaceae bacterium]|nr:copper amine oxidase N-terminal domain-containing protein [Desulfotomaculaceae bacterium]
MRKRNIFYTLIKLAVTINDQPMELSQPVQIIDGRIMVPLRFLCEALGAEVQWEDSTKTIYINTG